MVELGPNSYGKGDVRVVRVRRGVDGGPHAVHDVTVQVRLFGDFDEAFVEGDNRRILPTDTMKNAVYAVAAEHLADDLEPFGLALARRLLAGPRSIESVRIDVSERPWTRLAVDGEPHPHAFAQTAAERRTASIAGDREQLTVWAGVDDLKIMKTTGSAFVEFYTDELTTLPPAPDRLLATVLTADWRYGGNDLDFGGAWADVGRSLVATFATHDDSQSVQHTLYAMARAALTAVDEVEEIAIRMPNVHHLPFDLARFGIDANDEIFYPIDEPHGVIEAVITRSADEPGP